MHFARASDAIGARVDDVPGGRETPLIVAESYVDGDIAAVLISRANRLAMSHWVDSAGSNFATGACARGRGVVTNE